MPNRGQKRITSLDNDTEWLYDSLYDEHVEVVEVCVGCVYLRYPHQDKLTRYQCECGHVYAGLDEIEEHASECSDTNADEWFELVQGDPQKAAKRAEAGKSGFEEYEDDSNWHMESYSYQWPLDGHRFSVSDGPT